MISPKIGLQGSQGFKLWSIMYAYVTQRPCHIYVNARPIPHNPSLLSPHALALQMNTVRRETFQELWRGALDDYKTATGRNLLDDGALSDLEGCETVTGLVRVLERQGRGFKAFRDDGAKIRAVLTPIGRLALLFKDAAAEAASNTVPGGRAIFVAFGVLLQATRGVSEVYDALESVLGRLHSFTGRLDVYLKSPSKINPSMKDILQRVLVELLNIVGLFTKYIDNSLSDSAWKKSKKFISRAVRRTKDWSKVLIEHRDVEPRFTELDRLTGEELSAAVATMLDAVQTTARVTVDRDIVDWLNPPDPNLNQERLRDSRQEGTCDWFFDADFELWKEYANELYWINGNPGTGKSVLCSAIIDALTKSASHLTIVTYFYLDFRDESKKTMIGLLSSLIYQLAVRSHECYDLLKRFRDDNHASLHPTKDLLSGCFVDMLRLCPKVFIVLDALDEMPNAKREADLVSFLCTLNDTKAGDWHLLVTSRPEHDIRTRLQPIATYSLDIRKGQGRGKDLALYISNELSRHAYSDWSEDTRNLVQKTLTSKADGMFLWAHFQLQSLSNTSESDVNLALNDLPPALDDTYKRILEIFASGLNAATSRRIRRVFECIAAARRPLSPHELAEVLAIDFTASDGAVLVKKHRSDDPVKSLRKTCPSLIQIVGKESRQWVQFSHFSAQEYLSSDHLPHSLRVFALDTPSCHRTLAEVCLATLTSKFTSETRPPFWKYASKNLEWHLTAASLSETAERTLSRFLHPEYPFFKWYCKTTWLPIYYTQIVRARLPFYGPTQIVDAHLPLYFAAYMGSSIATEAVLSWRHTNVNAVGGKLGPALNAAASRGHLDVVKLLVQRSATIKIGKYPTALSCAMKGGHMNILHFFLSCRSSIEDGKSTALHIAAYDGCSDILSILLEHGSSVDTIDINGCTPLHLAAQAGQYDTVCTLLRHNANVNTRDKAGRTPLHWAANCQENNTETMIALLELGAAIAAVGKDGRTPLHNAAHNLNIANASVLVAHGASASALTVNKRTSLHFAADARRRCSSRPADIVPFLLEHGAALDARDQDGMTPLHLAAQKGVLTVARALLEHGAALDCTSFDGYSPIYLAFRVGRISMSRYLMERGAFIEGRTEAGWSIFHAAMLPVPKSRRAHANLLKLLLQFNLDVHERTNAGQTALMIAAMQGNDRAVSWLLVNDAHVNAVDGNGFSAVDYAAIAGRSNTIRVLLEYGADPYTSSVLNTTHQDIEKIAPADVLERDRKLDHHATTGRAKPFDDQQRKWSSKWEDSKISMKSRYHSRRGLDEQPKLARGERMIRRVRKTKSFEMLPQADSNPIQPV